MMKMKIINNQPCGAWKNTTMELTDVMLSLLKTMCEEILTFFYRYKQLYNTIKHKLVFNNTRKQSQTLSYITLYYKQYIYSLFQYLPLCIQKAWPP